MSNDDCESLDLESLSLFRSFDLIKFPPSSDWEAVIFDLYYGPADISLLDGRLELD